MYCHLMAMLIRGNIRVSLAYIRFRKKNEKVFSSNMEKHYLKYIAEETVCTLGSFLTI